MVHCSPLQIYTVYLYLATADIKHTPVVVCLSFKERGERVHREKPSVPFFLFFFSFPIPF